MRYIDGKELEYRLTILLTLFEEYKKDAPRKLTDRQKNVAHSLQEFIVSGGLQLDKSAAEATSLCDAFISDWESTGIKSAAVQQLIALLSRPHVRGAMISAEDIAANRYMPKLPAVPFEVDEDEGIAVKVVRIVKRDETLGATIRCDNGKIHIARLIVGGVAARSGCIQAGDRILEVNDCGTVTLKLVPADLPYSPTNDVSHVYLRAQYDYNGRDDVRHPCPEVALSFSKGDILELLVCNDDHWWQARCIGNGAFANCEDIKRLELLKSTAENDHRGDGKGSIRSGGSQETELIYESVCRMTLRDGFSRTIVLVGSPGVGRNELKRRLLTRFPHRFSTTVPHTTRLKRASEVEGVDYYFVERSVMERMIYSGQMLEFGEYKGNLYGTALCSVRGAKKVGTPLITPHPLALQILRTPEFMPFIVFIKPPDAATFKNTRATSSSPSRSSATNSKKKISMQRTFSDYEIEQIINNSALLHKQYGHLFDAVIVNEDLEESFAQLVRLINDLETKPTWVPLCWATNFRFD
ncbi:hypothetical protein KIN20_022350 [Parelaphostrongylus tenuis]|uniref:MAGUK p55 subfamily member 7 n=1 Tax=Parelaphostrongylus tenuis TaxID=148309 RepID=A0AAD5QS73_PARTN|nr:hypothetical protein KIN20_022350 [Parelaphostrongylus tenuis]